MSEKHIQEIRRLIESGEIVPLDILGKVERDDSVIGRIVIDTLYHNGWFTIREMTYDKRRRAESFQSIMTGWNWTSGSVGLTDTVVIDGSWVRLESNVPDGMKIPKRVAKIWNDFGLGKLPKEVVSKIGNAIKHSRTQYRPRLRFDQDMNWNPGTFGDAYSCFWDDREDARYHMRKNPDKFLAVQVYASVIDADGKEDADATPYARCWGRMNFPKTWMLTLFNAYSKSDLGIQMSLVDIARFVNNLVGNGKDNDVVEIELRNNGVEDGMLYINNGLGAVLTFGEHLVSRTYDLDEDVERHAYCDCCGDSFDDEYLIYYDCVEETLCDECAGSRVSVCDRCGNNYASSRGEEYCQSDNCGDKETLYVCKRCYDIVATSICDNCDEAVVDKDCLEVEGDTLCKWCVGRLNVYECRGCGKMFYSSNMRPADRLRKIGERPYCVNCYKETPQSYEHVERDHPVYMFGYMPK